VHPQHVTFISSPISAVSSAATRHARASSSPRHPRAQVIRKADGLKDLTPRRPSTTRGERVTTRDEILRLRLRMTAGYQCGGLAGCPAGMPGGMPGGIPGIPGGFAPCALFVPLSAPASSDFWNFEGSAFAQSATDAPTMYTVSSPSFIA